MRTQLLVLVLAVVLPAAGTFGYYVAGESRKAREAAYTKLNLLAVNTAARIDRILRDQRTLLTRIEERPGVRALDVRQLDPVLGDFIGLHQDFTNLGLRDRDANNIYSYRPNPSSAQEARAFPWFREGTGSEAFTAGNAFLGRLSGRWVSVLTYPVHDDAGKVRGLLNLSLDLLTLNQRLFQQSPQHTHQAVVDRAGRILLRSADPAAWIGKPLPRAQADAIGGKGAGLASALDEDGSRRLYAVATVAGAGWRVLASESEDLVYADYRERLRRAVVIGLVALVLVLALARHISLGIARPILQLAGTAATIAGGATAARARVDGPTEIAYVAQQFNYMLDAMERQREERAALTRHIEKLFKLARDIILLLDPAGEIVEANEAAVAAYGYRADELRGMNIRQLRAPDVQGDTEHYWNASARPEGVLFETVHRRKDGSIFPVEVSSQAIDIEGKPYRQSFIRDISERRAAEAQIRRLNSAYAILSETNQAIVQLGNVNELFSHICRVAIDFGGYSGAWIGLADEPNRRVVPAVIEGKIADYVRQIRISTDPAVPEGRGPTALALREGRPYFCQDFLNDPATEPWRELAARYGVRSTAALPLRRGGALIGTLNLYSAELGIFDAPTRALLEEMAADMSFALDNFEREAARKQAEQELAQSEARSS